MLFVSSHFGWVALLACLLPSLSQGTINEDLYRLYGITDECGEELLSCAVPVLVDYLFVTEPQQLLRRVREISLKRSCRQLQESWNCYRDLIGEDQCSRMNPQAVMDWRMKVDPVATEGWIYVCRREYKNFKANYRCLLSDEVFDAVGSSNCSDIRPDPDVMKVASLMGNCLGSVIEPICGAKAGDLVKGLIRRVAKRIVSVMPSRPGPSNEITPGEYADQLDILKKVLWLK